MWTDASPEWHTTGTEASAFPDGFTHIKAHTPYVWIIGRTKTDGL